MGGVAAGAAAEAAAKFVVFLCLAFPIAVMVGSICILVLISLVDRELRVARRIIAIAGAATAGAVGSIVLIFGAAYLLTLMSSSPADWAIPAAMAAIWLSLVCWQLVLVSGIFYGRGLSTDRGRPL